MKTSKERRKTIFPTTISSIHPPTTQNSRNARVKTGKERKRKTLDSGRRLSLNLAIGNREKNRKPNPENFGELSEVIHEITIPTLESLENIRKKHFK